MIDVTQIVCRSRLFAFGVAVVALVGACQATVLAQGSAPDSARAARRFAPGVLTTIEPQIDREDGVSIHDIVEIRAQQDLEWEPKTLAKSQTLFAMADSAPYLQDVWCLEFTFKPMRMIEVDLPRPDGTVRRELVWYMVYRVRNTGAAAQAVLADDGTYSTKPQTAGALRFLPQFVLTSHDVPGPDGAPKSYLDRVLPAANAPIVEREFRGGALLNSVQMASRELAVEEGRSQQGEWGVATWQGVDSDTDFFSIYVGGLTNAYQWDDPEGAFTAGDPPGTGRTFRRKMLQLNFWRPGDRYGQDEREIRYGVPEGKGALYEGGDGVTHRWVF
ncbi:MAG: hypothetical protein KDA61_11715, partial [Planctomycetales bacterium]|nr:hypothetical protein [Planctomycetales bacterium]